MKLALLADIRDEKIHYLVEEADVLVTLGDLHPQDVPETDIPHLYVHGNHDSPKVPFASRPGRHNLHLRTADVQGVIFGGFQGSLRYKPKGWFLYEEDEVESLLKGFPPVDVFIAHAPCTPLEIRDTVHDGFRAFDDYIVRAQPRLFLCGHVHQSKEVTLLETRCISIYGAALIEL